MAGHKKTEADADGIARGLTRRQLLELDACTRCGECRVWCPVIARDSRECISARGKIASLRKIVNHGELPESARLEFLEGLYACSACGQCHVVCPVRINTPQLWEQARLAFVNAGIPQPESQVRQLSTIKQSNNAFGKPQRERGLWAEKAWEMGLLKAPPPLWRNKPSPLLYFAGCTASFDPDMQSVAVQSARLLQEAGVEFSILGDEEPCCVGKLRRMGDAGFVEEARKRAGQFAEKGITEIVVSCAGCFKGLHSDYSGIMPGTVRVTHITQLLDRLLREGRLKPVNEVPLTVTYHDPCHLGRHGNIYDAPRNIIRAVPGLKLVEMPRRGAFSSCCGMGGGLKSANPGLQFKMSGARIREAESVGAEAVVTPCQTCCLGLLHGVEETSSRLRILHLNEALTLSICPDAAHDKVLRAFSGCIPV